jgi:hypothetical protein
MRAPASYSNATFTGVSVKTAPTLVFCLRFCLSATAFGKSFDFRKVTWCGMVSEDDRPLRKPDVEVRLLTSKFEFKCERTFQNL